MKQKSDAKRMALTIRGRLSEKKRKTIPAEGLKMAAVLIPICLMGDASFIILTKRSMTVEYHKGEISFPGGHIEPDDASPAYAALREAEEEIGLDPADVEVLGMLDDYMTMFSFHITPYVGVVPWPYEFRINGESEALIFLPLSDVLSDEKWMCEMTNIKGHDFKIYCLETVDGVIWGATARMLLNLSEIILGREPVTRPITETAKQWIRSIVAAQDAYEK